MPLTARCHTLRPDRTSGWLVYFELVPRGTRAAHFLIVGPAASAAVEHRTAALRAGQAAVRYLKDVPGNAPAVTVLEATERILRHEAAETGTPLEFGCAVLADDRLWLLTKGDVGLVPVAPRPGLPIRSESPQTSAVQADDRFFLGKLPAGDVTPETLSGLEHREGGAGGLVMTVSRQDALRDAPVRRAGPRPVVQPAPRAREPEPAPDLFTSSPRVEAAADAPPVPATAAVATAEPLRAPSKPASASEPSAPEARGVRQPARNYSTSGDGRGLGFWIGLVAVGVTLALFVSYLAFFRRPGERGSPVSTAAQESTPVTAEDAENGSLGTQRLLWEVRFSQPISSSPLVVGNRVVFGCRDGRVYALDRTDGHRVWTYAASDGFGSSPAVVGETVVIGGYDGRIYGLDLASGEERWTTKTGGKIVASPVADSLHVYVGSYDKHLYCLAAADGTVLWKRNLGAVLWASPVLASGTVVAAGLDGALTALDPLTGGQRWTARAGGKIYATPALADGKLFVGAEDHQLYAFDLATGRPLWKLVAEAAVNGSPAYGEGKVVVGTEGGFLLAADAVTGVEVWRVATGGPVRSRPAFLGPRVWVAGYDGILRGIRWSDGAEEAVFPTDSSVYSSPALVEGVAYFGAMDGRFLAVDLGARSL